MSRAILERVAARRRGATFRLHATGRVLAFSAADLRRPGFPDALAAARAAGFAPVRRLAGGQPAVFHPGTLAFAWSQPIDDLRRGVDQRFETMAQVLVEALGQLGFDATVGELPGEYCPGRHSIHIVAGAEGAARRAGASDRRRKVCGIGQRIVQGGAHVGGVIVVDDREALLEGLGPVYRALGLEFDPDSAGALTEGAGGTTAASVMAAVRAVLAARFELDSVGFDDALHGHAEMLERRHDLSLGAEIEARKEERPRRGSARALGESKVERGR